MSGSQNRIKFVQANYQTHQSSRVRIKLIIRQGKSLTVVFVQDIIHVALIYHFLQCVALDSFQPITYPAMVHTRQIPSHIYWCIIFFTVMIQFVGVSFWNLHIMGTQLIRFWLVNLWLCNRIVSLWRYQIETCCALLAICAGNSPVTGEFPAQRPVTRSFDVSFDLRLNKRLSKQS